MPTLTEIQEKRKKSFSKKEYRPWNIEGYPTTESNENIPVEIDKKTLKVLEVDPSFIINWEFHDRPENELGDIESLAQEFKDIGQQQPCIVRPYNKDSKHTYELIVGERRWRAATKASLPLKVIVKDINNTEAALIQASENISRKDLSDYARGMSYHSLIENGIIEQKDLTEKLKVSKQQVSRLLSFAKLPKSVIDAIGNMSNVSARTAEQIKQLCNHGELYIKAIINYADKIRDGKLGHTKLAILVQEFIEANQSKSKKFDTFRLPNNDIQYSYFDWKTKQNGVSSMLFHKKYSILIEQNPQLKDKIINLVNDLINKFKIND